MEAVAFQGDAFGSAEDYVTDNFGQNEPASPPWSNTDVVSEDDEEDVAQFESIWEPARDGAPAEGAGPEELEEDNADIDNLDEELEEEATDRRTAEWVIIGDGHGVKPAVVFRYTDEYPTSGAGGVLAHEKTTDMNYRTSVSGQNNPWAPFKSKMDWEVTLWAKLRGPGSTAFSDLLSTPGVCERLDLSYKSSDGLNKIIDNKLPGRPQFNRHEVVQSGEALEFYSRDILECLIALWGDPDFSPDLLTQPERHYADKDMTIQMYHDMNTGNWWWTTQVQSETRRKNITIVPIIISSDKTQLTTFRGKQAYPVYLTIGNLPKHIRRKPSRQGQVLLRYLPTSKLDHIKNKASYRRCLSNLFHHCMQYIVKPLERAGRNRIILTSGDGAARRCFPILAAYVGDYPEQILVGLVKKGKCPICPAHRDEIGNWDSILEPRNVNQVIEALNSIDKGAAKFTKACASAGIKPVQCVFWKALPYIDIYRSITPDILHQLYQGLLKHVIAWISRFLLALVADVRLPGGHSNARLVRTVCAVLDFIYLARYPIHTTETLDQMDAALKAFHDNRDIFISLGVHTHFHILKLHNIGHYHELIELYGNTDNFNTEFTERLHIDMAKDAYATSIHPTHRAGSLDDIQSKYGATHFIPALSHFVSQYQNPELSKAQVEAASHSVHIPFSKLSAQRASSHRIKFVSYDLYDLNPLDEVVVDSIHTDPVHLDKYRKVVPGRFDTAIISVSAGSTGSDVKGASLYF
ncbi:hypothetical protein GALMADRAFT_80270 [Galerina marginata CBS 339.88]|uniref:Uncharacterized protein n=1 Tax=Galerina marginata (strain CBS 339.88) TaxID=685588 RepID=A0A067S861_GALM3|nr:hypothetical protein GALMADRAFT_80270 [Galerina marginata CBS 339.88]